MGIFNKQNQPDVDVKRNHFDLSFQNNGTYQIGKIYPVMCTEVLAGDTFNIDTAFGLRFMPLAFPIQTNMRADLHFFYVRNRNLWKDFTNFFGNTGNPSPFPVLSKLRTYENSFTGSLGDYLGLPSTVTSSLGRNLEITTTNFTSATTLSPQIAPGIEHYLGISGNYYCSATALSKLRNGESVPATSLFALTNSSDLLNGGYEFRNIWSQWPAASQYVSNAPAGGSVVYCETNVQDFEFKYNNSYRFYIGNLDHTSNPHLCFAVLANRFNNPENENYLHTYINGNFNASNLKFDSIRKQFYFEFYCNKDNYQPDDQHSDAKLGIFIVTPSSTSKLSDAFTTKFNLVAQQYSTFKSTIIPLPNDYAKFSNTNTAYSSIPYFNEIQEYVSQGDSIDAHFNPESMPYQVSALPFRAYESIYNAFYRDERNNPYIVDGVNDPNRYIPTMDGGVDNNVYNLHSRNWEQDFLTSAMPTPQQGNYTPLVGITSTGTATFLSDDGTEHKVNMVTADNGDFTGVEFDNSTIPNEVKRQAMRLVSEGFSINDFRSVNAFQRWLETNIRRGYKYKDQILSHFGVDVSYAALDMPEFIGGVSQPVQITQINQSSATTEDNPLGSYAGQASIMGANKHQIHHFCDEPGFIIACLSVVPTPSYSQLLPKHFLKTQLLDYYFPEFGHLGFQPIKYNEVCPLQAALNNIPLTDTFGYNRAWYDYLAKTDEIHGQFRTTLKPFVLTREFQQVPSLNEDFLLVSQNELNEVFTVTEVNGQPVDTILGQTYFKIDAERKIPRYGIPRLE